MARAGQEVIAQHDLVGLHLVGLLSECVRNDIAT